MKASSPRTILKSKRTQKGRRQGTQKERVPRVAVPSGWPTGHLRRLVAVSASGRVLIPNSLLSRDSQQVASWPVLLQAQCPLPFPYFKFLTLSMTFLSSSRSWREQVLFSVCLVIQLKRDKHLLYAWPAKCHLSFMPPPKVLAPGPSGGKKETLR